MGALGRLLVLGGSVLLIYSLFMPAILIDFPLPPKDVGGIVVNLDMRLESSLYQLGDKLSEAKESLQNIPSSLNFLWLIFMALGILNILSALKPGHPSLLRTAIAVLPIVLLGYVFHRTATDPKLALGYDGLLKLLTTGFYCLLGGAAAILLGGVLMTWSRFRRRHD